MVSKSWQRLSCSCHSMSQLPFAKHPVLTDQSLHAAAQKILLLKVSRNAGTWQNCHCQGPVTVSACAKSDTLKSPLVFRETLIARKFYDL